MKDAGRCQDHQTKKRINNYVKSVLTVLGIMFVTFVIIPWLFMTIVHFIRDFLDENDRFDG